ncbi:MAG TPA: hypothetical protein VFJ43_13830, partial [Bacteroidia bacterium]|nr:hypothetical protein [Bacteroidia bacterium]
AVLRTLLEAGSFSSETRQVLVSALNHAKTDAELFRRMIERGNVSSETRQMLLSMLNESKGAQDDIDKFRGLIEKWFNEMMDRTKGWYKRKTKWATFGIGMLLAVMFNVNTLTIVNHLSTDKTVAKQVADLAQTYAETNSKNPLLLKHKKDSTDTIIIDTVGEKSVRETIKSLLAKSKNLLDTDIASTDNLMGLGWKFKNDSIRNAYHPTGFFALIKMPFHIIIYDIGVIRKTTSTRDWLGFLLTALAISLGAPFWFDLLSKLVQLRGTGDDTDKKQKSQAPAPGP